MTTVLHRMPILFEYSCLLDVVFNFNSFCPNLQGDLGFARALWVSEQIIAVNFDGDCYSLHACKNANLTLTAAGVEGKYFLKGKSHLFKGLFANAGSRTAVIS